MNRALIMFVRKPELGKVKTRLAATVGDEKALEVYIELLEHTNQVSINVNADKFVFYFNEIEENDLWASDTFVKKLQSEGNLGEKMCNAFSNLFDEGYKQIVIIGSDCPQLTTPIIENAFDMLLQNDVILGPANDGGYYLLGIKKLYTEFFSNIKWSTDKVLSQTLAVCDHLGLPYGLLPELTDIDTEADLDRMQHLKDAP